jgi:hypothetical protein
MNNKTPRLERRWLGVLSLCLAACGGAEPGEVGRLEQAYKHGPPSGPPYRYILSSYNDHTTPACGGKTIDGAWYYSTGAYTFGCHTKLQLRANGKCVVVEVVDNGPAAWVESKAQGKCGGTGYMIDASPLVSQHLFGTSSAGWSDCYAMEVTKVDAGAPTGPQPCSGGTNPGEPEQPHDFEPPNGAEPGPPNGSEPEPWSTSFIGDPCGEDSQCSGQLCFREQNGFPGGMCTEPCSHLCPDRSGKATTFCVTAPWGQEGFCHSRCDWGLHPQTGCRSGYSCVNLPRHNEPNVRRNVCVPQGGTFSPTSATAPTAEGDLPNPEHIVQGGCAIADGGGCGGWYLPPFCLLGLFLLLWRRRRPGRSVPGRS